MTEEKSQAATNEYWIKKYTEYLKSLDEIPASDRNPKYFTEVASVQELIKGFEKAAGKSEKNKNN